MTPKPKKLGICARVNKNSGVADSWDDFCFAQRRKGAKNYALNPYHELKSHFLFQITKINLSLWSKILFHPAFMQRQNSYICSLIMHL